MLNPAQASAELGVSRQWVYALIKSKRLPAARLGEDRWLIDPRDLESVRNLRPGPKPKNNSTIA